MQNNITNILLSIIAILLFVQVLQNNGPMRPDWHYKQKSSSAPAYPEAHNAHQGHDHGQAVPHAPAAAPADFDPAEMVYAGIKCPNVPSIPLSAQNCSGGNADAIKKVIDQAFTEGKRIGQVFDAVISNFGMEALTQEAQDIISARKK